MQFLHKDQNILYSYDNNLASLYNLELKKIMDKPIIFPYSQKYPSKSVNISNLFYGIHSNNDKSYLFRYNQDNIEEVSQLQLVDSYDLYGDKFLVYSQGNLSVLDQSGNILYLQEFQNCIIHYYNGITYVIDYQLNIYEVSQNQIIKIKSGVTLQSDIVSFESDSFIVFTFLNSHSILLDLSENFKQYLSPPFPSPLVCWSYIYYDKLFVTKFINQIYDFDIQKHLCLYKQSQ